MIGSNVPSVKPNYLLNSSKKAGKTIEKAIKEEAKTQDFQFSYERVKEPKKWWQKLFLLNQTKTNERD